MNIQKFARLLINTVVAISLCGFVLSCGGGGDSDSGGASGQSGTITITVDSSSIPADGTSSTMVHALIKDSAGNPVRHYTEVTFTTNLGHFRKGGTSYTMSTQPPLDSEGFPNPDAAPTGVAEVQFIAGTTPGSAKITVTSNGVTNSVYVTLRGGTGVISLEATPESISADGSSAYQVRATITDDLGNAVVTGTGIAFKTGLGHFSNGSKTQTVQTTDDTGVVTVSLIAGVVPGTTYIEATSGNVTQALSLEMIKTDPAYSEITVEANPSRIAADGQSESVITATVNQILNLTDVSSNAAGQPISGVPITFYKITSNAEPEPLPEANTYIGSGTSIAGPFYSYGGITTFQMTAEPGSSPYFTVWIFNPLTSIREQLVSVDTSGFPSQGYIDPETGQIYIVYETLITEKDVSLQPGNYQLEIQTNCSYEIKVLGDIGPAQTGKKVLGFAKTDSSGNAVYTYTADWLQGSFNIRAETGELSNSENALIEETEITQTSGTPQPIEVNTASATVYANGVNNTTITAQVWIDGNKAPDGTAVTFSASSGAITSTAVTVDGIASATLTAIASATSVVSTVIATVGTDSASTTVTFVGVRLSEMQATPPAIFANGSDTSQITLNLQNDSGIAIAGETITFVTTRGSLSSGTSTTNSEGVAATTLTAPTVPGTATITAAYGTLTATVNISFEGMGDGSITLTADPVRIPADGSSSSVITATIKYSSGVAVPKGTAVSFVTDLGAFSNGTQALTTITPDENGVVSVSLTAGTTAGSAKVTVSAINISQSVYVGIGGDAVSMTLVAEPTSIPADGSSSSLITATLKDSTGAAVTPGTSVTFTTDLGTFSGGGTSITVATSDDTGMVSVSLISSTTAGSAAVTATSSGVSQTIYVSMGGDIVYIALVADPTSIPADGSSSSLITATLKDSTGAAVTPGTSVTFTTNLGTFSGGGTSTTVATADDTGIVSVSLISSTTTGTATVTATSNGVTQSVNVNFSGSVVGSITVTANPSSLPADGTSTSIIRADVRDDQGNPVPDGESISFVVLTGTGTLSSSTALTLGGFAEVTYTASDVPGTETVRAISGNNVSGTVDITLTGSVIGSVQVIADPTAISADGQSTSEITATVKSPENQVISGVEVTFKTSRGAITSPHTTDDTGKAVATLTSDRYNDSSVLVTATCQGVEGTVLVSFTGLNLEAEADPTSVLAGGSSTITATFKDASGNPINGATLTFSTDKGTLSPSTPQQTDASGKASVTLTSTASGTATVTVTGSGATATVTVNFTRYLFTLSANPTTIRVGENSVITATILDNGVARSGETVSFSSSLGTLSSYIGVTGADGKTATILTASTQSGIAIIDGLVTIATDTPPTELSADTQVVITGGTATKIILTADPEVIATNSGVATLTANVYDANDQPVPDQAIYFRINQGPGGGEYLSSSVKITNSFGVATVQLYAGSLASAFEGVEVEGNTQPDFGGSFGLARLTIAGPVANIGVGMNLETVEPQGGDLTVDITGIATDVSGNPVADGTLVTFSVQAIKFDEDRANDHVIDCWDSNGNILDPCPAVGTSGFGFTWFSDDVNQDGKMYGCNNITCQFGPMSTTEDINHNGILDPGEDKNQNGVIDPIQGTVIDGSVGTIDGLARAKLVYPQPQANNITVRITAESGGISNFYEAILLCTQDMVDNGTCGIGY
jgi:adhesin/invasin